MNYQQAHLLCPARTAAAADSADAKWAKPWLRSSWQEGNLLHVHFACKVQVFWTVSVLQRKTALIDLLVKAAHLDLQQMNSNSACHQQITNAYLQSWLFRIKRCKLTLAILDVDMDNLSKLL